MANLNFSVEEDNVLVNLIEENRPLYDPHCQLYKDVCVRDNIWSAIAVKLDKTDEECKKRWKHIRDSYNRYKRKRKAGTGSAVKAKNSKWCFFERLRFLEQVPMKRNTECSINLISDSDSISSPSLSPSFQPGTSTLEQQTDDNDHQFNYNDDSQSLLQSPPPPTTSLITRPTCIAKHRDEFLQQLKKREENRYKLMQQLSQIKSEETDDDDTTFGNHVKTVLKKLLPRLKIQAKNEIFTTLAKYETLNLDLQEGRLSSTCTTTPSDRSGS